MQDVWKIHTWIQDLPLVKKTDSYVLPISSLSCQNRHQYFPFSPFFVCVFLCVLYSCFPFFSAAFSLSCFRFLFPLCFSHFLFRVFLCVFAFCVWHFLFGVKICLQSRWQCAQTWVPHTPRQLAAFSQVQLLYPLAFDPVHSVILILFFFTIITVFSTSFCT